MTNVPAKVIVYGSSCPACTQAKAVLDRFGIPYESASHDGAAAPARRVTTMPQIVIDDEFLGGLNQLLKLARMGGLSPGGRRRRALGTHSPTAGRGYTVERLDRLGRLQSQQSRRVIRGCRADQGARVLRGRCTRAA